MFFHWTTEYFLLLRLELIVFCLKYKLYIYMHMKTFFFHSKKGCYNNNIFDI